MEILHICSDFAKQSIYNQLVTHLSKSGIDQKIYVPVRTKAEIDKNRNSELLNVEYQYSFILNKLDRLNYFGKISKTFKDLLAHFDVSKVELVHAHFLFSDGGIAYELYKRHQIPYIVAVRNTDLNAFFKYFIHLRKHALAILEHASQIIFLSEAYRFQLFDNYIPHHLKENFQKKSKIIPNGINKYWFTNEYFRVASEIDPHIILYVGDFTKNKNIQIIIQAVNQLIKQGETLKLQIVGGGGDYDAVIRKLASRYTNWIELVDRISDIEKLKSIYRNADIFVMPSKYETFGLVYIEAMSQGMPVIYSKGQGIDGYYPNGEIGYAVHSGNVNDLADKIQLIRSDYFNISNNCSKATGKFSWRTISMQYIELYNQRSREIQ